MGRAKRNIGIRGLVAWAAAALILGQGLACSRADDVLNKRKKKASASAGSGPTTGDQEKPGADGDNTLNGDETANGSVDGQNIQLSLVAPQKKFLSPIILARSLAQSFNINWRAPHTCENVQPELWGCAGVEASYCTAVNSEITSLYCKLGGNSREARSYLGAGFTTGDLALLWGASINICKFKDATNATYTRLGVGANRDKASIAKSLVDRFLGGLSADDKQKEVDFIMATFFRPADEPGQVTFVENDMAELYRKFTAACMYLSMHEQQIVY